MIVLKVALVALSVLLASLAARRFGHAVGGLLGGLPMIAGPIIGFVLWQEPLESTRAIVLATLVCLPATIVHLVTFAWATTRWRWPAALLTANAAFLACGVLLTALQLPSSVVVALALAAPLFGLAAMPRRRQAAGAVSTPALELGLRVVAAMVFAAAIIASAGVAPAALSGLLLAIPITGNVLPCFTLPVHGPAATVALLAGFVRGLLGFATFFVVLWFMLAGPHAGRAYASAWGAALAVAWTLHRLANRWRGSATRAA